MEWLGEAGVKVAGWVLKRAVGRFEAVPGLGGEEGWSNRLNWTGEEVGQAERTPWLLPRPPARSLSPLAHPTQTPSPPHFHTPRPSQPGPGQGRTLDSRQKGQTPPSCTGFWRARRFVD